MFNESLSRIREESAEGTPSLHLLLENLAYQVYVNREKYSFECSTPEDDWRFAQDILSYVLSERAEDLFSRFKDKTLDKIIKDLIIQTPGGFSNSNIGSYALGLLETYIQLMNRSHDELMVEGLP